MSLTSFHYRYLIVIVLLSCLCLIEGAPYVPPDCSVSVESCPCGCYVCSNSTSLYCMNYSDECNGNVEDMYDRDNSCKAYEIIGCILGGFIAFTLLCILISWIYGKFKSGDCGCDVCMCDSCCMRISGGRGGYTTVR